MHGNEPHIVSRLVLGISTAPTTVLLRSGGERFPGNQNHLASITPLLRSQDRSDLLSGAAEDERSDVPAISYNNGPVSRDRYPILILRHFMANHPVAGLPATVDHMERN